MTGEVLLRAEALVKRFRRGGLIGRRHEALVAVNGVSLTIAAGQTVGIVGESGSGKTTLARMIAQLSSVDAGRIEWKGTDVTHLGRSARRTFRRQVQFVFQDPYGSLDPTKTVGHIVTEPLVVHRIDHGGKGDAAAQLLERVGLDPALARRRPDALSGGQRQRVAIARALSLDPQLLVADEPTSALDLSTRAEILNLFLEIQESTGLGLLLISHDFATIRHLSHRMLVMHRGEVVEEGDAERVASDPNHPYTRRLLGSVLDPKDRTSRRPSLSPEEN